MNLIDAVVNNDIEMVRQLLEDGADPNACIDGAELRPMHFAAQGDYLEIGKLLLAAGADIHVGTMPDGETPLDIAQLHENQNFVKLLLAHKGGGGHIH